MLRGPSYHPRPAKEAQDFCDLACHFHVRCFGDVCTCDHVCKEYRLTASRSNGQFRAMWTFWMQLSQSEKQSHSRNKFWNPSMRRHTKIHLVHLGPVWALAEDVASSAVHCSASLPAAARYSWAASGETPTAT